jgi:hypothetical protein
MQPKRRERGTFHERADATLNGRDCKKRRVLVDSHAGHCMRAPL